MSQGPARWTVTARRTAGLGLAVFLAISWCVGRAVAHATTDRAGGVRAVVTAASLVGSTDARAGKTQTCVYSNHSIAELNQFSLTVGKPVQCAVVFNDAAKDWGGWERPWFLSTADPDRNWANWIRQDSARTLIVTQNLFPADLNRTDWLSQGAAGNFAGHAQRLAKNLVTSGLGNAVIRLGHEANGSWYADSVPSTAAAQIEWRSFWAATVRAMRNVAGAHFTFDWTVTPQVRNLNLAAFYPGDSAVDVIGLDTYDSGIVSQHDRWNNVWSRPGGLKDVLQFAKMHGKRVSFPEWGLVAAGPRLGGNDDPGYMQGMVDTIKDERPVYQGYWYGHADSVALFRSSSKSRAIYTHAFGAS